MHATSGGITGKLVTVYYLATQQNFMHHVVYEDGDEEDLNGTAQKKACMLPVKKAQWGCDDEEYSDYEELTGGTQYSFELSKFELRSFY